jgi:dihydropyrimidinase
MAIIIQGGTIITSEKTFQSDILIEEERITKITEKITPNQGDTVLDAVGKFILPGAIDPHVHMHLPVFAGYSADDFYTGSKAAIFGGTTTIIDFVTPQKGEKLIDALQKRKAEAQNSLCDYSFHVSPVEWRDSLPTEIEEIIRQGCSSFKVYMAYKQSIGLEDEDLFKIMQTVAKNRALLTVHAELGDEIEELRNKFVSEGKTAPKYHPLSRPDDTEAQAVKKIIKFAEETSCSLYIVHVSARKSLEYIAKAQQKGLKVYAETCPHYLLLDDSKYIGNFEQTAPFVLSPPLRKKTDNEALWQAVNEGIIQTSGTDHCPFTMEMKSKGINDFRYIPNGAGSVEHRLELLYTYGVSENKISINKFVDLISTQAAKIFGLYPRKGEISVGADADIIIFNPEKERIISTKTHQQNCDNDIYEGFNTKGNIETVIKSGEIIIEKAQMIKEIKGIFLKRSLNPRL